MAEKIDIEIREMQQRMQEFFQTHWKFFLAEGIFFIILGIAAIIVPQIFTIAITLFIGWLLLLGGIFQIVRAIRFSSMPGFGMWLLIGVLQVIIGYFLIAQPMKGVLTLTMLMTLYFVVEGIAKISLALTMRPLPHWGWVLFSGFTALLLAVVVWAGWPGTAAWVLGLLLGINMIFLGGSLVKISLYHKDSA